LFWTNRVPNSGVNAGEDDFEDGARWHVKDLAIFDYFSVGNALKDGDSIDATVSFNLSWAGEGTGLTIDDGSRFHFEGRKTTATAAWSAHEKGFRFHSDPSASTQHTNFALVGEERNGVFFSEDD
jgi:hypothetical protein